MSSKAKKEQRTYEEHLALVERIKKQTRPSRIETAEQKKKRIKRLLANDEAFIKYYFARYLDSEFAWFQKKLIKDVVADKNFFGVAEFPREHAKSVIIDIFIPMILKAKGELTGVLLGSQTSEKAKSLLSDLQAELQGNLLYIQDFGEQVSYGDWSTGHFKTRDGIGFWAYGRGQSPRGAREANLRPNYGVIDDIDDKTIVKNEERVTDSVDWAMEDFYGALSMISSRLVVTGNRIHKNSILANIVGDINSSDPKRKKLYHLKVYAIENPVTHEKAGAHNGVPAWKERYTLKQLKLKMDRMGYRSSRREYFHEHIVEGIMFKNKWIGWGKVKKIEKYDSITTYIDPSFKNKKGSDYKAIVVLGKIGKYYHIIDCWIRQASVHSMVMAAYDMFDKYGRFSTYWMEANFMQDMHFNDFDEEATKREVALPLRGDKSKKPEKYTRIENLTPTFERGLFTFNKAKKDCPDMQMLISQLLGFGGGGHDDGPDALEGAKFKADKSSKKSKFKPRTGKYKRRKR